jgi:hypothetical protein
MSDPGDGLWDLVDYPAEDFMAGGKVETDPVRLAQNSEALREGAKKLFDDGPNKGDMWFFELYHHLSDCAAALRKQAHTRG